MAAIPGAAFNLVACLIMRFIAPKNLRTVDWEVIASLFDLSVAGNAFALWLKTGSMLGPVIYFALVVVVAIAWSLVAAGSMEYMDRYESATDVPFGNLLLLTFIVLPFVAHVGNRFEPYKRDVAIRLDSGRILFGKALSFEYTADKLTAVVVGEPFHVNTFSELLSAREEAALRVKRRPAYVSYIPADRICRLVVFAARAVPHEQLRSTISVLELSSDARDESGA